MKFDQHFEYIGTAMAIGMELLPRHLMDTETHLCIYLVLSCHITQAYPDKLITSPAFMDHMSGLKSNLNR